MTLLVLCHWLGNMLQVVANAALQVEIQNRQQENEKVLKAIEDMKTTLLSTVMTDDDNW